ncbi:MAG: hypothetical protein KC609_00375, partial [Myxococcales bacterium]|nr:hypothetical protein [Myxococcales bacterium]
MPKRASGIDVPRLAGDDALRRGGEVARRNARHVLGWPLWRKALVAFSLGFAALGVAVATLSDSALFGLYNRALAMRFF